jgi:hypothetical protein
MRRYKMTKNERTLSNIRKIAIKNLVDITGGRQSIEDWSEEITRIYHRGKRRPEAIVLVLSRYGECYHGELYITKQDFEGKYND